MFENRKTPNVESTRFISTILQPSQEAERRRGGKKITFD